MVEVLLWCSECSAGIVDGLKVAVGPVITVASFIVVVLAITICASFYVVSKKARSSEIG